MPRNVFFSFHYEDVKSFRANVVRQSSAFKKRDDKSKIIDKSLWEEAERKGQAYLKQLVAWGLQGTSTTCVLIGSETCLRPWVQYELVMSFIRGNDILGIYINRIRDKNTQKITAKGPNPLSRLAVTVSPDYKKLEFWVLSNGKWSQFEKHPGDNNRKTNSRFFESSFFGSFFNPEADSKRILFSDMFPTFCWIRDEGYNNLAAWIEEEKEKSNSIHI